MKFYLALVLVTSPQGIKFIETYTSYNFYEINEFQLRIDTYFVNIYPFHKFKLCKILEISSPDSVHIEYLL